MFEMGGKASDWMSDKPLEMKQPCIGNDIGHFGCNFPGTVVLLPQPVQQEINPVILSQQTATTAYTRAKMTDLHKAILAFSATNILPLAVLIIVALKYKKRRLHEKK